MSTHPPQPDGQGQPGKNEAEDRRFPVPPGAIVLILGLLLIGAIIAGIVVGGRSDRTTRDVTIADLRANPDRYDNRTVELSGTVEDVRELPVLSQYAVYTFRDETGSMLTLTQRGAPPHGPGDRVRLRAVYHAQVTLDDELRAIVEDQLGPVAGWLVSTLLPGIPLNVVFLEHESYTILTPEP